MTREVTNHTGKRRKTQTGKRPVLSSGSVAQRRNATAPSRETADLGSKSDPKPSRRSRGAKNTSHAAARGSRQSYRTPPTYVPTRREIARRCREIQATWTPATRRLRCVYRVEELVLLPVHIELEPDLHARTA